MQPLPALPQFRVMRRFPGTDSEVGQIADAPLTVCHIRSVRQRDFAPPFFIPEYIKYLPAIYYDARDGPSESSSCLHLSGKTEWYARRPGGCATSARHARQSGIAGRRCPGRANRKQCTDCRLHRHSCWSGLSVPNSEECGRHTLHYPDGWTNHISCLALYHVTPLSKERA